MPASGHSRHSRRPGVSGSLCRQQRDQYQHRENRRHEQHHLMKVAGSLPVEQRDAFLKRLAQGLS
jgi:hypothetical protein